MADVCPWWMAYGFDNWLRRCIHRPREVLSPYVRQGMGVLDVGCGMGVFSIGMARMVGDHGWVIAVDLQQEMLNILRRRALKAGVSHRIHTHCCTPTEVGVHQKVDFALAFWMVHEVPDTRAFFKQILSCLRPEGAFLVAEPRYHVSARAFRLMVSQAESTGLKLCEEPRIRFSRAALFGP